MSAEGRKNISLSHKKPRPYRWIKVCQLDADTEELIKIWDSIKEAAKSFGDNYVGNLIGAIKGKNRRKFYRGYKWKYYEDYCKEKIYRAAIYN